MANQSIIEETLAIAKIKDEGITADFSYSDENLPNDRTNNLEFTDMIDIEEMKIEPIPEEFYLSNQEKEQSNMTYLEHENHEQYEGKVIRIKVSAL